MSESRESHVPGVTALVLGALFLGRAGGALWWHYRYSPTHPSAKGDISSLRCVRACVRALEGRRRVCVGCAHVHPQTET